MLASYAAAYPELDETALRGVAVMSDERYVVRTERLADAHAAHAPVWRSRYDGPYTGIEDDPDPEFAQYAGLLARRARRRRRGHLAGRRRAWPRPCTTPGARSRRPAIPAGPGTPGDGRPAMIFAADGPRLSQRPVRARPADLGRAGLAAGHLVARGGNQPVTDAPGGTAAEGPMRAFAVSRIRHVPAPLTGRYGMSLAAGMRAMEPYLGERARFLPAPKLPMLAGRATLRRDAGGAG